MTPTEQDKELREQVHKLFGDHQADDGGYQSCYDGKWIDMTNEVCAVADFITADRKRVALEARLEELKKLDDEHQTTSQDLEREKPGYTQVCVPCEPIWERIAELKAQQEEV